MKKIFTWVIAGTLIFSMTPASGQNNYWQELSGKTAPSQAAMTVKPDRYTLYTLETNQLKQVLAKAGRQFESGVTVTLPGPGNTSRQFVVWETPMMESKLALAFPEMKTYTATATDNPEVTAKLDFTDDGFRAMIYDGSQSYFIDPYSNSNDGYYVVFYADNLPGINKNFNCDINAHPDLIHPEGLPVNIPQGSPKTLNIQNGSVRHNYRLAMACTGEYAQLVTNGNPSPSTVLSKIVSTVNRINGIYERELSVTFTLIGDEANLIYTDPNTDPYTCNFNMACLLPENQANVTAVIGASNYDVGHILCTAGGGLAAVSVVCSDNNKASGASTSGGPDDFSTSLHELGHQFSAMHTFSANTGGCYNNGDASNDYEPGSGSTIMSYGGLCNPNNIVSTSDNYFHVRSLIQINNFLTNNGSTCGTTTAGLNSVSLPAGLDKTYNIPGNTPFVLTSPTITPTQANASISYNWEQYDIGNFGGTEAQNGQAASGPIMRSYPPSDSSNIRYFPINRILDGSYTDLGERLPGVARDVRFKLTARSILLGWGSFATMDSVLTLKVSSQGTFRVNAPSSNMTLNPGDTINVTWSVAGTDQAPVSSHYVNIFLSLDDGQTFPVLLKGSAVNSGNAKVIVPNVYTTEGHIMVQGVSNIFYDVAKGKLIINGTNGIEETSLKNLTKVFPNPASDIIYVSYSGSGSETFIVNMYDMSGRLVWSGKMNQKTSIPVADFARGQYQIQLINGKTAVTANYPVTLK